ncbi:hypothetical protein HPB50_023410 [Hyalomma asiaticum]|uniref:Uncharacterized protein n=1 Tax=Hyalomma asiaticum TaxID=266040 RepID=A0ACB7S4U3_HYAAI|nr:hypothetical protein HPB50_023410 [Hyalomma asiaticum]
MTIDSGKARVTAASGGGSRTPGNGPPTMTTFAAASILRRRQPIPQTSQSESSTKYRVLKRCMLKLMPSHKSQRLELFLFLFFMVTMIVVRLRKRSLGLTNSASLKYYPPTPTIMSSKRRVVSSEKRESPVGLQTVEQSCPAHV